MSYLIDTFQNTQTEIDGRWWLSKPYFPTSIKTKLKWVVEILKGKAIAVHFKEDEPEEHIQPDEPWERA